MTSAPSARWPVDYTAMHWVSILFSGPEIPENSTFRNGRSGSPHGFLGSREIIHAKCQFNGVSCVSTSHGPYTLLCAGCNAVSMPNTLTRNARYIWLCLPGYMPIFQHPIWPKSYKLPVSKNGKWILFTSFYIINRRWSISKIVNNKIIKVVV